MRGAPKPTATTSKGPVSKTPVTQTSKAHDSKHLPR